MPYEEQSEGQDESLDEIGREGDQVDRSFMTCINMIICASCSRVTRVSWSIFRRILNSDTDEQSRHDIVRTSVNTIRMKGFL